MELVNKPEPYSEVILDVVDNWHTIATKRYWPGRHHMLADRHYPFRCLIMEESVGSLEVELGWMEWEVKLKRGSWTGA